MTQAGRARAGPVRIGLVTGLSLEVRLAEKAAPLLFSEGTAKAIAIGGSAERARTAVQDLADAGAAAVVSFGLAGGLRPGLVPGQLLLPRRVRAEGCPELPCDVPSDLYDGAAEAIAELGRVSQGTLLTAKRALASVADKSQAFASSGAEAVDMESYWVAEACQARQLPFLALRAISDPAERALPQAAANAMREDGEVAFDKLLAGLLRRPGELPALCRLGMDSRTATAALSRAAGLLLPRLCRR